MSVPAAVSAVRRQEVIDALRRGTVPRAGLDLFAVGMDRFEGAIDEEIAAVASGRAAFKAVRGEYGSGKTFFARWLAERVKRRGLATSEIQISETETPLHRLETVYRRLVEQLSTASHQPSALREVIEAWFFTLEEDVLAEGGVTAADAGALAGRVDDLMERRLAEVARTTPAFAAVLRAYRRARLAGDEATASSLLAWLGGQPNVAASARRTAGVKGDLDHFAALGFLQGLLTVLRDCGHPGLLVVLDEIETLQRVRSDVRDKGLNALRQLIDDVDAGRFPGLYLVDHRNTRLLRRAAGCGAAHPARPAARHRLRHATGGSTRRGRCSSGWRASTCPSWPRSAAWSATCMPLVRVMVSGSRPGWTTRMSGLSRRRWRVNLAARSASRHGCSCANSSPTCWTGWRSSPTSTRASTTR